MLFKVRPPFAVHLERVNIVDQAGTKVRQPVVTSYHQGETVDLSEKDAEKHLHKLEPMDDAAKGLMETKHEANAIIANARATSQPVGIPADLEDLVERIVARRLQAKAAAESADAVSGRGAGKTASK